MPCLKLLASVEHATAVEKAEKEHVCSGTVSYDWSVLRARAFVLATGGQSADNRRK